MPNWKSYESSVRLLSAIVAAHPGLKLDYNAMQKHFGSDTTTSALAKHFQRHVTPKVQEVKDCVAAGGDCKDLNLGGDEKKAIGGDNDNGGTPTKATPRKRAPKAATTPGKRVKKEIGNDNEDEEETFDTPSKKSAIKKVATGRVTKSTPRAKASNVNYNELSDDEDISMNSSPVKAERFDHAGMAALNSYANGNGNGNGNGYANSFASNPNYSFASNKSIPSAFRNNVGGHGGYEEDSFYEANESVEVDDGEA